MFSGTIRKNLDPFGEHEDEAIWWALDEVSSKLNLKYQLLPPPPFLPFLPIPLYPAYFKIVILCRL